MYTRVIKFDSLPDTVWSGPQNNHFFAVAYFAFVLKFECRIVIRSLCIKFSSTSVYQFKHALDSHFGPLVVYFRLQATQQMCDLTVCVSFLFRFEHQILRHVPNMELLNSTLQFDQVLNLF
ncbi:hypothetical protein D3C86_1456150 [compost metagenome]